MRQLLGFMAVLIVITVGWLALGPRQNSSTSVKLTFHAVMGGEPLVYDQFVYSNPGGEGTFRIRDFRFYLSNLSLRGGDDTFAEPDSYHLLRFDNADKTHSISLTDVPLRTVETVRFLIGVDPEANSSIEARGDLDPNSQMAWNWEVGYKFVVFEGGLQIGEDVTPLVYHVGFSENAREVVFTLPPDILADGGEEVHLNVDVGGLFEGTTQINMEALSSVKFNRVDAEALANNYSTMIAPAF
ncbi:MbnP family protein [Ruegeria lacuscaerulensis]|uniref:MbnP family protein n=1 Tax=Ruegeria lacuscaerulensis TaxID=55218 RepID=UPI00147A92F2|nr:MbnP family protein [Ruegeria lacuscaerulensis]